MKDRFKGVIIDGPWNAALIRGTPRCEESHGRVEESDGLQILVGSKIH